MRKKLLLIVLALMCAIACTFGFAACGDRDGDAKASCTLTPTEHVRQVQINIPQEDVPLIDLGAIFDRWSATKQIVKNKEYDIDVVLDYPYEIGTLKMSVNGEEITLTPMINSDTGEAVPSSYTCKYTPTADFTITFSGAAKLQTTTVTFNAIDWQPCYDYYYGTDDATAKGDALKAKIQNNVRIKLLVNDIEKAPFNGMKLVSFESALSANSVVAINITDKIEIQLYTDSNELILNEDAIYFDYQVGADIERSLSADKKTCTVKVDEVVNTVAVTVRPLISPIETTDGNP